MIDHDTATLPPATRELVDRSEVTDLISRLGVWLDEQRIDDLGAIFTEDVVGEFTGQEPFHGLDALIEHARDNLPKYDRIQHVITNVLVDLNGERAAVRANLIATHVHDAANPSSFFQVGGLYAFDAVRDSDAWRLSKVKLDLLWTAGSPDAQ
jgi:hypothetical protein